MPATSSRPRPVRFGDFLLDLQSGELTGNGNRLLLPEQPFRILTLLVGQPGTLVTRDDLRRELWADAVRAKARRAGLAVTVHCRDMRDFTLPRPVDLVLAAFASLNCLADRRDLPRVLESVARALAADGWFLFDVNTPLTLRTQYSQTCYRDQNVAFKLVQRGSLEADGRRAKLDFDWFVPSGRVWRHVRETLWHVCWTDREIRRALRVAGLDRVRRFDGADVRPSMAQATRGTDACYLARKRSDRDVDRSLSSQSAGASVQKGTGQGRTPRTQ